MDTKLEGAEFVLFNGGHTRVAHIENGTFVGWVNLPDGYNNGNYEEIQMCIRDRSYSINYTAEVAFDTVTIPNGYISVSNEAAAEDNSQRAVSYTHLLHIAQDTFLRWAHEQGC